MAGNRAVTALLARDPKAKPPPAKTPAKKELPKQNYVVFGDLDPIVIESVQLGPSNATAHTSGHGASREAAAPTVSEIVITTVQGDHSSELFRRSLQGEGVSAEIVFVKPGESKPYMKIKLSNVMISSYSVSGHGGGPDSKPMESWTLNATKIEYETSGAAAAPGGD